MRGKEQSKIQNKMKNYIKIAINEENCKPFGNCRKVMKLWIIIVSAQEEKQKNRQTNKQTK